MDEIIYRKENKTGQSWFLYPQDRSFPLSLFGLSHNNGKNEKPMNGDIVSVHVYNGGYLKVGNFFITEDEKYIVLGIDQLGFIYGKKLPKGDYLLIDKIPETLLTDNMVRLENEFRKKLMNKDSRIYHYVLK